MKLKAKIKAFVRQVKKKATAIATISLTTLAGRIYIAFASNDTSATIQDWMPLIIQMAMLGMIMGILKKFGKI